MPYKPFPGNNRSPSAAWSIQHAEAEIRSLRGWPVTLVPVLGQRHAAVRWPQGIPALAAASCGTSKGQPWTSRATLELPPLELEPENRLPSFAELAKDDPPAAGPISQPLPPWNQTADARILLQPSDAVQPLRLPNPASNHTPIRSLELCGAAPSPQPQAVEAFLPLAPEPQIASYVAHLLKPQLQLDAAEWTIAAELAEPVPAPPAQAVEAFLPSPAEPQMAPFAVATVLPQWQLDAAEWMVAVDLAGPVPAPAAQAVEAFLPSPAEPQMAPFAVAIVLPQLPFPAAEWVLSAEVAEAVPAPAAQAVESFLPAATAPQAVPFTVGTWLPRLALGATEWIAATPVAEFGVTPMADVVESFLPLAPEPQPLSFDAPSLLQPQLNIQAADWTVFVDLAPAAPSLAAAAVERFLPPPAEPVAVPQSISALQLPRIELVAAEPERLEEFIPPIVVANPSEAWMQSPPATEVVREVIPSLSGSLPLVAVVQAPNVAALTMGQPMVRWIGGWQASAPADPVFSYVRPHLEDATQAPSVLALPDLRSLQLEQHTQDGKHAAFVAGLADEDWPNAAEPARTTVPVLAQSEHSDAFRPRPGIQLPGFALRQTAGNQAAEFKPADSPAAKPTQVERTPGPVIPELKRPLDVNPPASPTAVDGFGLPTPGPTAMEYFCQRASMTPVRNLDWKKRPSIMHMPRFAVRPLFERLDEAPAPPKRAPRTPAFAEIFTIDKVARRKAYSSSLSSTGKAIAASLLVGLGLWFGAGAVKIGRQMAAINTSFPHLGSSGSSASSSSSSSFPSVRYSAPQSPSGPVATVRRAIQSRAAVELTDTFRRMEAWHSSGGALPSGWTRHAEGYVRTGALALYQPAQSFVDYHFEFFGGIEKKSMSWAVRARDAQNYYAMKFNVVEPGLRPVISAVHYPVLGGKKGQRVETLLNVMVHNRESFHVAVDVKGNRVITSIEGQEVDSWTDDTLKTGGVGFFSDVGESARLYWIRVTKNQDWLGHVCAYLSGSETNTAELWRGEIPSGPEQPNQPGLPSNADVTLAETEEFSEMGPHGARILKYGRTELCRS